MVMEEKPVVALDRASFNQGKNALYEPQFYEDGTNPTLVAKGPSAVCYVASSDGEVAGTLDASYYKGTGTRMGRERTFVAYCIGNGQPNDAAQTEKEVCKTLNCMVDPMKVLYAIPQEVHDFVAENNADAPHQQDLLQTSDDVARTIACGTHAAGSHLTKTIINEGTRYIVRRLTPTECARLQGFPDRWGDIDHKDDFTDEEYEFWLNVRNTHAEINGKAVKDYTKKQMLTWYNKLHTDSSEYKMWGNGIALPCALYVMEGIADAMKGKEDVKTN